MIYVLANTATTLFQVAATGLLIAYIALIMGALFHLRKQSLSERELLLWDVLVLFTPIGALIVFLYFPAIAQRQ